MGVVCTCLLRANRGGGCAVGSCVVELVKFVALCNRNISLSLQSVRRDDDGICFDAIVEKCISVFCGGALDFEGRELRYSKFEDLVN